MEKSHTHWRPALTRGSPPDQIGQSTNQQHPDVYSDCMSQSCERFDSDESKSSLAEREEDQNKDALSSGNSFADSNGHPILEFQGKNEEPKVSKNSLLTMLKHRYKEVFVVIVLLISFFTALNNG